MTLADLPLTAFLTLQQMVIFVVLGATAMLWFDTKGHYRQRLPHWELVGHILGVACAGFLVSGFIHFLRPIAASRNGASSRAFFASRSAT